MQSRKESFIEAVVNTVIGFVVSFAAWPVIAWKCDMAYDNAQHWEMVFWFTVLSVARGYAVRRWFNNRIKKLVRRLANAHTHS